MFLLKTLDIVTKHCKKTLQESTFISKKQVSRQKHYQKFSKGNEKEKFNLLLAFYIYKLLYVYNLSLVDICPKTLLICTLSTV